MAGKTILLTGGTGYLGSKILKKLVDEKYDIILLKRSFSNTVRINDHLKKIRFYDVDRIPLETIFSQNSIDMVVHCATNYGRRENDPLQVIEANLLLPLKLLELGKNYRIKCFINTDTGSFIIANVISAPSGSNHIAISTKCNQHRAIGCS